MATGTIFLLGGYGSAGRPTAELLMKETDRRVVIAGRDGAKADAFAAGLNERFPGGRAVGIRVDATDSRALESTLGGADALVVLSPTRSFARGVVRAAIAVGVDVVDVTLSRETFETFEAADGEARDAGVTLIHQAGFIPGLPSLMVRYAVEKLDRTDKAAVGEWMRIERFLAGPTAEDFFAEMDLSASVYREGERRKASGREARTMDFGPALGRKKCYPFNLPEMESLPRELGLSELGIYSSGFGIPLADFIFVAILSLRLNRISWTLGPAVRLFTAVYNATSKPPYGVYSKLEACGELGGRRVRYGLLVGHEDGYAATAIATTACVLQLIDGSIERPGSRMMGRVLEPGRAFADMTHSAMVVREEITPV
jgi:hypothetical protein